MEKTSSQILTELVEARRIHESNLAEYNKLNRERYSAGRAVDASEKRINELRAELEAVVSAEAGVA